MHTVNLESFHFILWFLCHRKKVLDFYQRACLSGYCSAFAYKPMQVSLSSQLNGKCMELAPGPCLFSGLELPSTTPIKHNSCRNSWSSDGKDCDTDEMGGFAFEQDKTVQELKEICCHCKAQLLLSKVQ